MAIPAGAFTIPTRVFLSPEHRHKLEALVREQEIDLPELLTELLTNYLDQLPTLEVAVAAPSPQPSAAELNQRRAELRRLRARLRSEGRAAPAWLTSYIADLEDEIARLEEHAHGENTP